MINSRFNKRGGVNIKLPARIKYSTFIIMRQIISFMLVLNFSISNAQDTIFLDIHENTTDRKNSVLFKINPSIQSDHNLNIEVTYYLSGEKNSERGNYYYSNKKPKKTIHIETYKGWYKNRNLKVILTRKDGNFHDTLKTYWENGQIKRMDIFNDGKLIDGLCYDNTGKEVPHFDYEIFPQYPGGDNALLSTIYNNLKTPQFIRDKGLTIRIVSSFTIDEKGNIFNIEIVQGYNKEVENEVKRVILLLKQFKPAYQDGVPIKFKFTLPITFSVVN